MTKTWTAKCSFCGKILRLKYPPPDCPIECEDCDAKNQKKAQMSRLREAKPVRA